MSHFSPLLWLCAVSAAALNSFTALDPTGAYEQYLDALGENTPAIAAFFDAAESGVFPWTIPGVSEPIPSPVPDLLPQPPEVVDPVIPDEPEEPVSQFTTVDASYFDDALFLGDSHTDGFHDYAGLGNATYFTKNGLTVKDAVEKSFIELDGKKVTLAEALGTRQFGKVYILLGINEIGAYTAADWAAQYKSLLDLVREKQPDAVIFIQSIFHTTRKSRIAPTSKTRSSTSATPPSRSWRTAKRSSTSTSIRSSTMRTARCAPTTPSSRRIIAKIPPLVKAKRRNTQLFYKWVIAHSTISTAALLLKATTIRLLPR